ncbi:DNA replication protein DnaD [Desulforamulus reducens MI-1]|uniref:DNA replication protein DnaD n=1 Tax=Desulforamulus reducens (strain ATCC BAA-1160 / DSM 100696 / MI-1) TaxID=349161 RepID=A4J6B7_DESRM|nr:DnaD domain protein [Desulforamulus reducens]ABO50620.1 DNA replication protein DnaD [Desulforamulus reducens MI-1]
MSQNNRRALKKEFDATNMTVYFGSAIFSGGITGIPNLFLKYYRDVGITDSEMMLVIQLLRLRNEENMLMPKLEILAGCLSAEPAQIEKQIKSLLDKRVIGITNYYIGEEGVVKQGYDFEPLVFELSEVWALNQKKELDNISEQLNNPGGRLKRVEEDPGFVLSSQEQDLCQAFENEFGRLLSPMEIEQIIAWLEDHETELILEALRQAVIRGKHNFKYIGSILREWYKNNIRTIKEVESYQRQFEQNRLKQQLPRKTGSGSESNNRADLKKKTLMRSMYS